MSLEDCLNKEIAWVKTDDFLLPWHAEIRNQKLVLRVNDFPEAHMYTLLIDGKEIGSFNDWPAAWTAAPLKKRISPLVAN